MCSLCFYLFFYFYFFNHFIPTHFLLLWKSSYCLPKHQIATILRIKNGIAFLRVRILIARAKRTCVYIRLLNLNSVSFVCQRDSLCKTCISVKAVSCSVLLLPFCISNEVALRVVFYGRNICDVDVHFGVMHFDQT